MPHPGLVKHPQRIENAEDYCGNNASDMLRRDRNVAPSCLHGLFSDLGFLGDSEDQQCIEG
jgi:hypothetical protein